MKIRHTHPQSEDAVTSTRLVARTAMSAFIASALAACAAAAPAPTESAGLGNLGESLLDDALARSLSADPAPKPAPAARQAPPLLPVPKQLDRMLRQGDGRDVGRGGSPLEPVVAGMRRAESLIHDDADDRLAVPVQKEVVTHLERLITQMEKQCNSCNQSGQKPNQEKQASKRTETKPGQCDKPGECDKPGSQAAQAGVKPNQSGTTSLSSARDVDSPEAQRDLVKQAWGHLPERMREQMLQGADSEFLPEYREELRDYYRRLAERGAQEDR